METGELGETGQRPEGSRETEVNSLHSFIASFEDREPVLRVIGEPKVGEAVNSFEENDWKAIKANVDAAIGENPMMFDESQPEATLKQSYQRVIEMEIKRVMALKGFEF